MFWVLVFCGIALAGVVMLVCYAVWLAHKAADVLSEVDILGQRAGELADLIAQVGAPAEADDRTGRSDRLVGAADVADQHA